MVPKFIQCLTIDGVLDSMKHNVFHRSPLSSQLEERDFLIWYNEVHCGTMYTNVALPTSNRCAWAPSHPDGHAQCGHCLVSQEISSWKTPRHPLCGWVKFLSSRFDIPFKARPATVLQVFCFDSPLLRSTWKKMPHLFLSILNTLPFLEVSWFTETCNLPGPIFLRCWWNIVQRQFR